MKRTALALACVSLSACVDWPDVPQTTGSASADGWPELVPLEEVSRIRSAEVESDRETLLARAAGLNARASVLRRPISSSEDMERLRAQMAR